MIIRRGFYVALRFANPPSFVTTAILLLFCIASVSPVRGAEPRWQLPAAESGVINGHTAILFWPQSADTHELLDPRDCEVRVTPKGTRTELTFACGEWFVPPVGAYIAWVESDRWMSPAPLAFRYGGGPFPGKGTRVVTPVVAAGRVSVFVKDKPPSKASIHFLSLPNKGYAIERRATLEESRRGIRMPAFGCLVGLFTEQNDAVAISRPVAVKARDTMNVTLAAASRPMVVAVLDRPITAKGKNAAPVRLTVNTGSAAVPPDVFLDTPGRVYSVWYALPKSRANLTMQSDELALEPISLEPDRRTVSTVRSTMKIIPKLAKSTTP